VADSTVELLRRVPLFSDLKSKELEQVARAMNERTVEAGDTLAVEGKGATGFFVIESGTAKVTVDGEDRRLLGPGDYFGEIALILEGQRTATVTAETPVHCYGIAAWEFRPLVRENASVAWKLCEALARLVGEK
jgi:CRP-like cAMP-binding protein